ncbi:MAG: glutamine--fructose-6-phosphate transaminase (isomerizing) [Planktomarina sp.]|nr:glutamine--fructose-6-phosphate transaminase (isomerizing) [Planktomarina sp.]MDT2039182.1 glutamine--fructose-6-phosphate transaminase (isomerizing) [Planktomarina sp.]MDT2048976.1 glutamine--fructose-6-phosphate transaminase (isomerizing) [Planktomarina sp.]
MCGIVGVLGQHEAAPLLVEALKRLEYRGYDSAGIATVNNGALESRRAIGKLVNLSDLLVHNPLAGKSGIGHTRWATHGTPSVKNAHPHQAGDVAVVHNGIIENFVELRAELNSYKIKHKTDTDTETVALMAKHYLSQGLGPTEVVKKTLLKLKGAFALAFLFQGEDDLMIVARQGSPLAIGHGNGEMYVGSDAIALAHLTNKITYLDEGDFAKITRNNLEITDKSGNLVTRKIRNINMNINKVDKDGYKHFMAKEIAEQPSILKTTLQNYLNDENTEIELPKNDLDLANIECLTMVACGTAFYAALTAKYWFEKIARVRVEVDVASEFRYREPPVSKGTIALFVSQSGETADTLAALRYMSSQQAKIISVVNVPESSIARESDLVLPLHAGVEIGVASTKAFTAQLTVLALLAIKTAKAKAVITEDQYRQYLKDLNQIPELITHALSAEANIRRIATELASSQDVIFLGRGAMYPLAMEGALKLKEISYIHAEGYPSGELKHGPIALIDKEVPVVVIAPMDPLFDKSVSNMQEVMARSGKILLLSCRKGLAKAAKGTWATVEMPETPEFIAPIIYAVPAQLLAYHTALAKGTDADQPRNLAKSVTVE